MVVLRVSPHPSRRGEIVVATLGADMAMPVPRHEKQPLYEYRLPPEMEDWTLERLAEWYLLGKEFGTLPAAVVAPAAKDDQSGAAKLGYREKRSPPPFYEDPRAGTPRVMADIPRPARFPKWREQLL